MPAMLGRDLRERRDCACGGEMRTLARGIYYCRGCGRAQWGDERVAGSLVFLVGTLTIVGLVILWIVGVYGERFR